LLRGLFNELEQFKQAHDKLEPSQQDLITFFSEMCDWNNSKFPPNDVKLYEDFLISTKSGRGIKCYATSSRAVNILSPSIRKASINSPKRKNREEELHNQKKQLENQLQNKDLVIEDQQALLLEKDQKIKEKGTWHVFFSLRPLFFFLNKNRSVNII
jgi:hypothetical protein